MQYLLNRNGWYFFDRRVPKCFSEFDPRKRVRVTLNTQCKKTAIKRMVAFNYNIEHHWDELYQRAEKHCSSKFKKLVMAAKQMDFAYIPATTLLELPIIQLLERVLCANMHLDKQSNIEALFGKEEMESILLSDALERFWNYSKPKLLNKNPDQQRKWKNTRIKAVKNFINQVEDKPIHEITNLDLVKFRDWWLERMQTEDIKAGTVNKDFTHLKGVLETVSTHEQLDLDIEKLFKKIHIKEEQKGVRNSYSTEFIQNKILKSETLDKLNDEATCILFACANTGARPTEIVNLVNEDIILEEPIPYIYIRPRKGYSLKTKESERKIPLTGIALRAFEKYPEGFPNYIGKSDRATSTINKWLSKNNLRPTQKHSLYSFRHSFQDRLNALELNDRIQCILMGHKFQRPVYGEGASLEHLQEVLERVDLASIGTK